MKTFTYVVGDEIKPKIELPETLETSLFSNIYKKSFSLINRITQQVKSNKNTFKYIENSNNIIAFVGDRGAGKTSVMMSFINVLMSNNKEEYTGYKEMENINFKTTDLIDPSFFDKKHDILNIVLGKMFKEFKYDLDAKNQLNQSEQESKRRLISAFEECMKNIRCLKGNDKGEDTIEALLNMTAVADLKESIKELVDRYLEYFKKDGKDGGFLIIPIDDIDLHTSGAFTMVEQIRKYFIQPNVIILMAVKLDQLQDVIFNQYAKDFKDVKEHVKDDLKLMSERYISKLIPLEYRMYLNDLNASMKNKAYLLTEQVKDVSNIREVKRKTIWGVTGNTLCEMIVNLIFSKTKLKFHNSKHETSLIIPHNLRELNHFIALLQGMEHPDKNDKNEIIKNNRLIFKQYFVENWCASRLTVEDNKLIKDVLKAQVSQRNKLIVQYINKIQLDKDEKEDLNEVQLNENNEIKYNDIKNILDINNISYNVSLGDVLQVIDTRELISYNYHFINLKFALQTLYSIILSELYDQQLSDIEHNILSSDDYITQIGGGFINTNQYIILPREQNNMKSRSFREINIEEIIYLSEKIYNSNMTYTLEEFNIFEFFLLTTNIYKMQEFRKKDNRIKQYRIANRKDKIYFDVMSILYNFEELCYYYKNYEVMERAGDLSAFKNDNLSFLIKTVKSHNYNSLIYRMIKANSNSKQINNIENISEIINNTPSFATSKNNIIISNLYNYISETCELPYLQKLSDFMNDEIFANKFDEIYNNDPSRSNLIVNLIYDELNMLENILTNALTLENIGLKKVRNYENYIGIAQENNSILSICKTYIPALLEKFNYEIKELLREACLEVYGNIIEDKVRIPKNKISESSLLDLQGKLFCRIKELFLNKKNK